MVLENPSKSFLFRNVEKNFTKVFDRPAQVQDIVIYTGQPSVLPSRSNTGIAQADFPTSTRNFNETHVDLLNAALIKAGVRKLYHITLDDLDEEVEPLFWDHPDNWLNTFIRRNVEKQQRKDAHDASFGIWHGR